jgi:hypothetical protein
MEGSAGVVRWSFGGSGLRQSRDSRTVVLEVWKVGCARVLGLRQWLIGDSGTSPVIGGAAG